jgi:phosphomethylpyrimidine kinase
VVLVTRRPADAVPRVLAVAGTDPTGAAGIQADLKSIAANRGHGMAVVTSLVAQNGRGVRAVHTPPARFLSQQLHAVSDEVAVDAVKIGMLGTREVVEAVDRWLAESSPQAVVLDPVLIASSGRRLVEADAQRAMTRLFRRVDVITPNLPELAAVLGVPVAGDWDAAREQALRLSARHGVRVVVKGGHLRSDTSPDALVDARRRLPGGVTEFVIPAPRIDTQPVRGTGCSLSSALATRFARAGDWTVALTEAKAWLADAIRHADELDTGARPAPVHHFHQLWSAPLSS